METKNPAASILEQFGLNFGGFCRNFCGFGEYFGIKMRPKVLSMPPYIEWLTPLPLTLNGWILGSGRYDIVTRENSHIV